MGVKKFKDHYNNNAAQSQPLNSNQPSNMIMQDMSKFDNSNNVQNMPQEYNMVKPEQILNKSKFNFFNNTSRCK